MRPRRVDAGATRGLDGRRNDLGVLIAEQAVLAGVRVQAADGDAGAGQEKRQRAMRQFDDRTDARTAHARDGFGQRHVGADMGHGDILGGEHRGKFANAAKPRDQFRVADEMRVARPGRFLVHRHRDDSRNATGQCVPRRRFDVAPRCRASLGVESARCQIGRVEALEINDVQASRSRLGEMRDNVRANIEAEQVRAGFENGRIPVDHHGIVEQPLREASQDDFRSDARRVAHRDRHAG